MRDKAYEAAAALLLSQRLHNLFINVATLDYDKNVIFESFQNFCRSTCMSMSEVAAEKDLSDGCTLIRKINGKTRYIVLYNTERRNTRRRAFTLAHEIGHIYLGHYDDCDENEAQANRFASELLMPECLLREYIKMNGGSVSPAELCSVFNISHKAASLRLRLCGSMSVDGLSRNKYDGDILRKFAGLLPYSDGPIVTA